MVSEEAHQRAFEALKRKDAEAALAALEGVDADRPEVTARVAAYRAQALRDLGRLDEADRAALVAVRAAKAAGDVPGVSALRQLHADISVRRATVRAADAERQKDADLVDLPDDALLDGISDPTERAARLLRKGNAALSAGRPDQAIHLAWFARDTARAAGAAREEVLALLLTANADPDRMAAWIHEAHAIADHAGDTGLVSAVARAAALAGVRLAPPAFG